MLAILSTLCLSAYSQATGLADLKFGRYQIADSQWNVGACMYTTTCQIYSKNPGTAYKIPWTSGQLSWATGDYVAFTVTGNTANPFTAIQYSSNGTQKAVMGAGHIINMGNDYFFFVGSDNNTGQLFSMTQGFANTSGVTWTGTLNPTVQQVNTYATSGSTTPLAAGQTAQPTAPAGPTPVSTSNSTIQTTSTSGTITYTYNQPVIITTWSDGTTTTANNGNAVLIRTVNTGQFNATSSYVNNVMNFATRPSSDSKIYITQIGSYNTTSIDQTGTKNNYVHIDSNGNNNTTNITQSSTNNTATNYVDIKEGTNISSSNNQVNIQQTSTGGAKGAFVNIQDNNNVVTLRQQDSGNHWAEVSVSGGNKSVDLTQQGSGNHMASVQLTGPQPASLVLQQSGSTSQYYSIQSNCTTAGGCAPITVQQGR